jgi:hypothetical protein
MFSEKQFDTGNRTPKYQSIIVVANQHKEAGSVPYTMSDYYSLCGRHVVRYYPMAGFRVGKKTKISLQ